MSANSGIRIFKIHDDACFFCTTPLTTLHAITVESRQAGTLHVCISCARAIGTELIGESWQRQWDLKQIPIRSSCTCCYQAQP